MNRPISFRRAPAPILSLLSALALLLAPAMPALHAAPPQREGSLDVVLGELPPPALDEPDRPLRGALVLEVELGGAGDQKDLREGDIIVEFEGQVVRSAWALAGWIRREGEGSIVSIHIWREGRKTWLGNARLSGRAPRVVVEDALAALHDEVAALRDEVAALREEIARLR